MAKTVTLTNSWQASLDQLLSQAKHDSGGWPHIVIMGIGNEMRADDAAGMLVAHRLLTFKCVSESESIRVVRAEHAPENATWELRGFEPHLILLVDAADMGELPGAIRSIEMDEISGMSASTHSLPLSMLARYLTLEFHCPVALLGIQPASNDFDGPVCPKVVQAVNTIVNELVDKICRYQLSVV